MQWNLSALGNAGEKISFEEIMPFHFDKRQLIS